MSALRRLIEKGASGDVAIVAGSDQPEEEAAPETRHSIANLAKLRASAYIAIGKLGRRLPKLVNSDISVMQTFFDAMSKEDKETQLSLQVHEGSKLSIYYSHARYTLRMFLGFCINFFGFSRFHVIFTVRTYLGC